MTYEELCEKRILAYKQYLNSINSYTTEYARSNNPIKMGDIITDHVGSIKVEGIKNTVPSSEKPQCIYYGIELKKDLTPMKKQSNRHVYQQNLQK